MPAFPKSSARRTRNRRRMARRMSHAVNDDFALRRLVENQIGVRRHDQPADCRIVRACPDERVQRQEIDEGFDTRLNPRRPLRGMRGDGVERLVQFSERQKGITDLHKPCFAHTVRTWSSEANSPRAAAPLEAAIAARSLALEGIGGSSLPASCNTRRAISSCAAAGRPRAASTAR